MKVLIAEDNPDDRRLLRQYCEKHGCEVIEAAHGQEGLEMVKIHKPDLIISDALMPMMDGFQFLRAVKTNEKLKSIPFVFYSAVYTGQKEAELAISLGAEAFIIKPKEPEEFWDEVKLAIDESKREKIITAEIIESDKEFLEKYAHIVAMQLEEKVKALEESEKRYRDLIETARDVIFTVSLGGLFTSLNPAFEFITGWSRDEWLGKEFASIIHPDDLPVVMNSFQRVINGEKVHIFEARILTKSGEYKNGEILANPLIKDGAIVGAFGIARDITERKNAEKEIKKRVKELEEFYDLAVGRELRMIELKKEIEALKKELSNYKKDKPFPE
ncbi:MAG: PAS domain S-box protein [Nitrospirota bacterium]